MSRKVLCRRHFSTLCLNVDSWTFELNSACGFSVKSVLGTIKCKLLKVASDNLSALHSYLPDNSASPHFNCHLDMSHKAKGQRCDSYIDRVTNRK